MDVTDKIRDIKIGILTGDLKYEFKCDLNRLRLGDNLIFSKPYWSSIKKHKDCVITGSACLYAFGLIDRYPTHDVDLLIDVDKNANFVSKLTPHDSYNRDGSEIKCIGFYKPRTFFNRNTIVDFFELNKSHNIIEVGVYKFQHPLDVISTKASLAEGYRHKDIDDINMCFDRIYSKK